VELLGGWIDWDEDGFFEKGLDKTFEALIWDRLLTPFGIEADDIAEAMRSPLFEAYVSAELYALYLAYVAVPRARRATPRAVVEETVRSIKSLLSKKEAR
jgi:hypothetical protein